MKHFGLRLLAVTSLIVATGGGRAPAAVRPHYGGVLRVSLRGTAVTLDPTSLNAQSSPSLIGVSRLLFDNLVTSDEAGRIKPALAQSWQNDSNYQRWTFALRPGVVFSDGAIISAELVAASLRTSNPEWNVSVAGDSVLVQLAAPDWSLPATLALPRNAIVNRSGNTVSGSGAYKVAEWHPGHTLSLTANENYWGGRPYIDSVQVQFAVSTREQATAVEFGRTDLADIPLEAVRALSSQGSNVSMSAPVQLIAIASGRDAQSEDASKLMEILALSIDRKSIRDVILRGQGEVTGALLPQWLSGYEFLFSPAPDLQKARQLSRQLRKAGPYPLGYDSSDPTNQLLAERIALNAKDAGITLQPLAAQNTDLRLTHVQVCSADPSVALREMSRDLGLPAPRLAGPSIDAVYQVELGLLQTYRVIPVVHIPVVYLTGLAVKNWSVQPEGTWDTYTLWLKQGNP
jgi:peptide/nickel transport system substrate-binding protein